MPPKHDISLLFHPKKNTKPAVNDKSPRKQPVAVPNPPKPVEEEEDFTLPDGPYQEFKLMSSALNGWKYDVMKFDSRKVVDIAKWVNPIKLNRKELRRDTDAVAAPVAVAPMLGPDGKPVIGADGKIVMVDAEGRPITDSPSTKDAKGKAAVANGKKRFQKKTKQVFLVPEEVRQLRKEERYPWVMEDSSPNHGEMWVGQLEDVSRSETHAFFMPAANDIFKFVPAHRWYKFQKKLKHDLPTSTAEVESLYNSQKRDPQAWLASRNGRPASANATIKTEPDGRGTPSLGSLVYTSGTSLGPGGRKLKTVDSGMSGVFDEDEDPSARRRREREYGEEGDLDEQVFEDNFDDDEGMVEEDDDEAAKELEERLKREYKTANKHRDAGVVESDEEEEAPTMSKQAKAMQKLIRNREGNEAYDSDEEKNPYASSEEEEEEELPIPNEPASQPPNTQPSPPSSQPESRAGSQTPKPAASPARPSANSNESRPTSPVPSPGHSGHSIVARRAAGDKVPKPSVSRGGSPPGSRATSPVAPSRATSPAAQGTGIRAESPPASNNGQKLKRKAEELPNGAPSPAGSAAGGVPKAKKRKAQAVVPVQISAVDLKNQLVEWLKNTPNATTRDCIHYFTPYLTDQEKKTEFSSLVREVAQLKGGVLVLRAKSGGPLPEP
ncbi:transcription initiation factor [Amanita muscaria]